MTTGQENSGFDGPLSHRGTPGSPGTAQQHDTSALPVSVLVYVRPWNRAQMDHLARGVWGDDSRISVMSEHGSVDGSGFWKGFHDAFKTLNTGATPHHFGPAEIEAIIGRCRLLRHLDLETAMRLLVAAERAVSTILDRTRPSFILSLTVDSYILDILARLGQQRAIPFIGIVPSFLTDHFRITTRGEGVHCRDVDEDMVKTTFANLAVADYRPDFLVSPGREARRRMWRMWIRNLPRPVWFALRRRLSGDRLNYHFWVSQIVARQFWTPWPQGYSGIGRHELDTLTPRYLGPPRVYLPLQMSPETTIDYWSADRRWINYENHILRLIRAHRGKACFVVKEHPNLVGFRSPGFYPRLAAEPNCTMVLPEVRSNDLVTLCDAVLVCTGSAGFEAAIRGKPVISDSAPYYAPEETLFPISTLEDGRFIDKIPLELQNRMVKHLLERTLPGRFLNNGTWSARNPEHRAWSSTMAASIRQFLGSQDSPRTET